MKKILLFFITIIFSFSLFAQQDSITYENLQQEYQDYVKKETAAFEKFKEERDREFSEFLKQDWENIKLMKAGKPVGFPGPQEIPVYESVKPKIPIKKIPEKKLTKIEIPGFKEDKMNLRPLPKLQKPTAKKDYAFLEVDFYGSKLSFIYPKKFKKLKLKSVSEKNISEFWTNAAETDHFRLIEQMLEYKNDMNLNDFAFYKLCEKTSNSILSSENEQRLLTWFLLSKTGYQTKVGYEKQNIHLLIPAVNLLYSYSYFVFDNLKYYVFEKDCQIGTIYTYTQDYPDANKIMNFNMYTAPAFAEDLLDRNLKFSFDNKKYKFDIKYNKNLIDFYSDYPQGEIQIFFNAGISHAAKESLDRHLDSVIVGMDEITAANFLLHFTQTAFSYKTDGEQFGYEKFFFPEEIFHYKHADCEDRSVFFSYLVNEYLNLSIVGLNYPGHIATAVKFSDKTDGMYFQIGDERFVICDPTYINAPVGVCMPEYVKSEVSVLTLNNSHLSNESVNNVWEALLNKGFIRTNYKNDIIQTESGEFFVVGILQDSIDLNGEQIQTKEFEERLFICKTNSEGEILNIELINGTGLLIPSGIELIDDKIYLIGYYSEVLELDNVKLDAKTTKDMFVSAFDSDLNNLWIKNSGVFQENKSVNQYFNLVVSEGGEILYNTDISEQSYFNQNLIFGDDENNIVFHGYYPALNSVLAKSQIYEKKTAYEFATALNELTQSFIARNYNPTSASLFAFLTILESGKLKLKGKEIMAAALAMNPEFENQYPKLHKNLRDIVKIKSKNDIVIIDVKALDNFKIGGLIIDDNARISIRSFKNGNIQVAVLSGISYKPFVRKHRVNYLKLYKSSGNIVIDYDEDNDQKVINVEKDLLK